MHRTIADVSIMSMELIAISTALDAVANSSHRYIVIFTDSKSALQHLARCASGIRGVSVAYSILIKISNLIKNDRVLRLQWIPSHIGIYGNEEADRLANLAATEGQEFTIQPNFTELLYRFKKICLSTYKEYFDERSREKGIWYKVIQCQPPPIPWFVTHKIRRSLIVLGNRIRSGHFPSRSYAHLIKRAESPLCETCGVREDVYHLLMECVRNSNIRRSILSKYNLSRYDVGVFTHILAAPASEAACMLYGMFTGL